MKNLFDGAFWKFLSGFVLILVVSISLLTIVGNYHALKIQMATFLSAYRASH